MERMQVGDFTIHAKLDGWGDLVLYVSPGLSERITCVEGYADDPQSSQWAKVRITRNHIDNIDPDFKPGQSLTK